MIVPSPMAMPQRRPPRAAAAPAPVPQWSCRKRGYPTQADADAALSELWTKPGRYGTGPIECRAYRCPRHGTREVWHLTSKDQGERTA